MLYLQNTILIFHHLFNVISLIDGLILHKRPAEPTQALSLKFNYW